jgi:carbamoyl-phosphate synthase large subunit
VAEKPSKVLIIGSGPIIIGQAAEFDYAGTQACKAMREEGVTSVLVNSNPATIMTDEGIADIVYIEPLTVDVVARIIARERPEGLLPTLGGQTGLNLAVALAEAGVLDKYNVRLLGTPLETIRKAEDRELFRRLLHDIGEPAPESATVTSLGEARLVADLFGLPLVVRPAYTLGGTGGGIAFTNEQLEQIAGGGLAVSPIHQVLLERCLLGWKEIEYEVMRDGADNCITVCNMENIDPMGVHTGDSIVVAPSQTLNDKEYQMLRSASLRIIRALGVEGGCNIQFALAPRPEIADWQHKDATAPPYYVIEVNPRVSRSSALASKATGYPIARVAAKIAVGKRLDEIGNAVTGKTSAAFEPALDYLVVKIPRWPFDKFPFGDRNLGTQMKATGEVMAIDRTFEGALQKAVRSLEVSNRSLLWEDPRWSEEATATAEAAASFKRGKSKPSPSPYDFPLEASDERLWALMAALRRDAEPLELARRTGIDPWFLEKMANIIAMEKRLLSETLMPDLLREAKRMGFSDEQIGVLADRLTDQVRFMRILWGIRPVYKMVDTCAAEFDAATPYFYSTYEQENEAVAEPVKKALVIGSGPIRIGQGIEFDYCSVHAVWALQEAGYKALIANSNPETVSTDFDTSDRLYFEPLDEEGVRDILENEAGDGLPPPSIVQFGGQTAINLAERLHNAGLPIQGVEWQTIHMMEDRREFEAALEKMDIPQIPGGAVSSVQDALDLAQSLGYPVIVRPSFVLGGIGMDIVYGPHELVRNVRVALDAGSKIQARKSAGELRWGHKAEPVYLSKFVAGLEVEIDALCDGARVLIPGIMEHIEGAGVHSGDSVTIFPSVELKNREKRQIEDLAYRIAKGLSIRGLLNIQFIVDRHTAEESRVYVLEVNPRASRTIPFISKATGIPLAKIATWVMIGKRLDELNFREAPDGLWDVPTAYSVKAPVFSMSKLGGVDTYLGPQMRSTGEAMGIDLHPDDALAKALLSAGLVIPQSGAVLLSVADRDKESALDLIRDLAKRGLRIFATPGTATLVQGMGWPVEVVSKTLEEGHPNSVDLIRTGIVDCVINTPGAPLERAVRDGYEIRRASAEREIPCFTSIQTAQAAFRASARDQSVFSVQPLTEYRRFRGALFMVPSAVREHRSRSEELLRLVRDAHSAGWRIYATEQTAEFLERNKIEVAVVVKKVGETGPTVLNLLDKESIQLVVNVRDPLDATSARDEKTITKVAQQNHVPVYSSLKRARGYIRGYLGAANQPPFLKGILLTVAEERRDEDLLRLARIAVQSGQPIYATQGTAEFLRAKGNMDAIVVTDRLGKLGLTVGTVIYRNQVSVVVNVVDPSNRTTVAHYEKIRSLARNRGVLVFASVKEGLADIARIFNMGD